MSDRIQQAGAAGQHGDHGNHGNHVDHPHADAHPHPAPSADVARHGHSHDGDEAHGHTHGLLDPSLTTSDRGLWAVKWSFVALFVTASLQLVVVLISGSVALLADTIHNFADASTAIPLGVAFLFARRAPNRRFTYGYGRVEDLAGLIIVAIIFGSAIVAFYTAINRLLHPHPVTHLAILAIASVIGFAGNELVAIFRIRVGKEIGSAALIADGYHARTDGWTSLAVLVGAAGVYFGFPLADPIIGLLISIAILGIVKESVIAVVTRALDGVEPEVLDEVAHSASHVPGVLGVTDVRARWIGHQMRAEVNITVPADLTVEKGHALAKRVEHEMRRHLKFLSGVLVHVDPAHEAGQSFHSVPAEREHASHQH